jgi:hypothetical protein
MLQRRLRSPVLRSRELRSLRCRVRCRSGLLRRSLHAAQHRRQLRSVRQPVLAPSDLPERSLRLSAVGASPLRIGVLRVG